MGTKYLYIDDESLASLEALVDAVMDATDSIKIVAERVQSADALILHLKRVLHQNQYDGLILDWRLDQLPNEQREQIQLRAGAIAQEIRTQGTERAVKELPIVLWSTYSKLSGSYVEDHTSHDLFDGKYHKEKIVEDAHRIGVELVSLATGYQKIIEVRDSQTTLFVMILCLTEEDYKVLDPRLLARFSVDDWLPAHEYARFILKELIHTPGPLISEALLAARLGVDKNASSDWPALLEKLPPAAKYNGPFHEAWPRWWSHLVERKWWRSLDQTLLPLSRLSAGERVTVLKQHTGLDNLVAASPIQEWYSDYFQTICVYSQKPLDPIDGVVIDGKEPLPWQAKQYLSMDAALERKGYNQGLRPHPLERDRLQAMKES